MVIPKQALYIISKLNENNYEAFVVGGCVRDGIMGRTPKDWDITTQAPPEKVKPLFHKVFDTGIEHGTVTVVLDQENYEVTTYRIDGKYSDNRRPDAIQFTKSLKEDLLRRDFTMNAIAYHPQMGFQDPFHGARDIHLKLIRGVGDPEKRFQEDALRMMRALRFACQLGFDIEEKTYEALLKNRSLIQHISIERVRDEFMKALTGEYTEYLYRFNESGLIQEFHEGFGKYLKDVLPKYITLLKKCEKDVIIIFALLLKELKSSDRIEFLTWFKMDNKSIKRINMISEEIDHELKQDHYHIRKKISLMGKENFMALVTIKSLMYKDQTLTKKITNEIYENQDPLTLKDLKINGNDLVSELNIQGEFIGACLHYLLDQVLRNPQQNTKEQLTVQAHKFVAQSTKKP